MNANLNCGHGRIVMRHADPELCAAMYLDGMTVKEIGHDLCHTAASRVTEGLRQAGVWHVPIFKAQHLAARKKRQPIAGAV